MIEAYPLQWPLGYKRTPAGDKKHAAFQTSFAKARDEIIFHLKKMRGSDIIISSNVPLKRDGTPYSVPFGQYKNITDDTGIAVYFIFNKEQKVICCDAYLSLDDNMQAINRTVEALRGIDRWKCSDIINQTFTGFKALPEKISVNGHAWFEILEVKQTADANEIKEAFRKKAMQYHPDRGGNIEMFDSIQKAYQQGLSLLNKAVIETL